MFSPCGYSSVPGRSIHTLDVRDIAFVAEWHVEKLCQDFIDALAVECQVAEPYRLGKPFLFELNQEAVALALLLVVSVAEPYEFCRAFCFSGFHMSP